MNVVFDRAAKKASTSAVFVVVVIEVAVTVPEFAVCGVVSATFTGPGAVEVLIP